MSTATKFVSLGNFPFCPLTSSISNPITLSQAMEFYWNLETFSLSFSGTLTNSYGTFDFSQSTTAFPPSASFMNQGRFYVGGPFPSNPTVVSLSSLPSNPKQPRERVCYPQEDPNGYTPIYTYYPFGFRYSKSGSVGDNFVDVSFWIFNDTVDPTKWFVAFHLQTIFTSSVLLNYMQAFFTNFDDPTITSPWQTGTITIGGLSFAWKSAYGPSITSATGGTMSATSTNFTY